MRHWHRQFLGRTQLPPILSALASSEFFTLNSGEARSVLTRYGLDMRLGTALQIGFFKDVRSAARQAAAHTFGRS